MQVQWEGCAGWQGKREDMVLGFGSRTSCAVGRTGICRRDVFFELACRGSGWFHGGYRHAYRKNDSVRGRRSKLRWSGRRELCAGVHINGEEGTS